MRRAVYSGMPVARVGRGNTQGFVPLRPRWPAGGHPVTRGDSPLRRIPSPLPSRTRDRRKADQAVPIPDSERNLRKNSTFFARAR